VAGHRAQMNEMIGRVTIKFSFFEMTRCFFEFIDVTSFEKNGDALISIAS
jgi:hypothetical protein